MSIFWIKSLNTVRKLSFRAAMKMTFTILRLCASSDKFTPIRALFYYLLVEPFRVIHAFCCDRLECYKLQ